MRKGATAALCVTETVSYGVLYYAFGVLLPAMERDLRAPRTAVALGFSVTMLGGGLLAPWVGLLVERGRGRAAMTVGSLVGGLGVLLWSRAGSLAALYAACAVVGVAHALVLYEPAFARLARWYPEPPARARVLVVVTSCAGLSSLVFAPRTAALEATRGWRGALVVLALVLLAITVPLHAATGADTPVEPTARPRASVVDLVRDAPLRLLAFGLACGTLMTIAVTVHVVPFLEQRGFSHEAAARLLGAAFAAQVPARLLLEPVRRRLPDRYRLALVLGMQGVGVAALALAPHPVSLGAFVVFFGGGTGLSTLARANVVADWYGPEKYARMAGLVALPALGARALAPVLAAALYDATRSYDLSLVTLVSLAALGATAAVQAEARRGAERC